jgi:DNA-binding PadR family transcriptional regulator
MGPAREPTTLHFALLGLLSRRALTGYEILKRFRRSIVFFWHAERSRVYAELGRLEGLGLLRSEVTPRAGRPNQRRYTITTSGRAALREWLEAAAPDSPVKDAMLLRTFFADLLPPGATVSSLRRHAERHRRVLAEFEAIREALQARYGSPLESADRALFFGCLVLEQGIRFERMYAEWCDWAAHQTERRGAGPDGVAPAAADIDFIMTA